MLMQNTPIFLNYLNKNSLDIGDYQIDVFTFYFFQFDINRQISIQYNRIRK